MMVMHSPKHIHHDQFVGKSNITENEQIHNVWIKITFGLNIITQILVKVQGWILYWNVQYVIIYRTIIHICLKKQDYLLKKREYVLFWTKYTLSLYLVHYRIREEYTCISIQLNLWLVPADQIIT